MSYLHVMVLTTLMIGINSSKINQCLNSAITYLKGTASYLPHSGFTLYKLDDSVTWCEAYHYCSQVGQRMASIKNPDIQESLGFAMHTANVRELIWLGARRKDFGNDWTWINKSLTDCKIQLTSTGHPSANMMAVNNSIKITNDEELSDPCCLINGTKLDIRNTTVTWFQAQNICQQAGGWLTTNEEPPKDKAAAKCWIGLYRNPWIWIDGTATPNYEPVLFSAWADSSDLDRQCMIIDTNKSIGWTSVQCTERYHYVLCQDNSKSKKSTVGWGVGVFLAILSVGSVTFSLFLYLKSRNSDALPTFLIERSATSGESVAYRPKDAQKNRIIKKIVIPRTGVDSQTHLYGIVDKRMNGSDEFQTTRQPASDQHKASPSVQYIRTDNCHTDFSANDDADDDAISVIENDSYQSINYDGKYDYI